MHAFFHEQDGFVPAGRRQDNHWNAGYFALAFIFVLQFLDAFPPVHDRHIQIHNDEQRVARVGAANFLHLLQGRLAIAGFVDDDIRCARFDFTRYFFADALFIVYQQDRIAIRVNVSPNFSHEILVALVQILADRVVALELIRHRFSPVILRFLILIIRLTT